jgi:hypothetical protein
VGAFALGEAQTLEEAQRALEILPLDRVVPSNFPILTVNEAQAGQIPNGRRLAGVILPDGTTALLDEAGPNAVAAAVLL